MKKLVGSLLLAVMLGGLNGCRNGLEPEEDGNHRSWTVKEKPIMKTVRMQFGGEYITEYEEPLLRAEDGDTYVGINVFRKEKGDENANEENYAYGLFKRTENISINVLTGHTYRFEATILTEREHKMYVNNKTVRQPFQCNTERNATGSSVSFDMGESGKFIYSYKDSKGELIENHNRNYMPQLSSGTAYVDAEDDLTAGVWYPKVKRYYGTNVGFDPGISETVDISMLYKCFGLKFEVVSLPSGYVTVKDVTKLDGIRDKNPEQALLFTKGLTLSDDNKVWEAVYSMHSLLAESETFNLEFTWHKGGDATEKFVSQVTVTPGKKKILKLNINGDPNYVATGNINLIISSDTLTDDIETIGQDFE